MPDPVEEAALGIENCPAYRGRASVFIEGLNLGGSGYLPNLTFEIGTYDSTIEVPGLLCNFNSGPATSVPSDIGPDVVGGSGSSVGGGSGSGADFVATGISGSLGDYWFVESKVRHSVLGGYAINIEGPTNRIGVFASNNNYVDGVPTGLTVDYTGGAILLNLTLPHEPNIYHTYRIEFDGATNTLWFYLDGQVAGTLSQDYTGLSFDRMECTQDAVGDVQDVAYMAFNPQADRLDLYLGAYIPNDPLNPWGSSFDVYELQEPTLESVLQDLAIRSGLDESYLDFSSCSGQFVRALAVSQVTTARSVMELLGSAYLHDFVETDTLKTVARGGSPVETVPYIDMGASLGDPIEPLPLKRSNDVELSAQVAITYSNVLNDYQKGTEYSDRLLGAGTGVSASELALGLTPQEAKRIADVRLTDAVASIVQAGPVGLLPEYSHLEPADVVVLTGHDDSTYRVRILKITDDGLLRTLECVLDDATVINSAALTDEDYTSTSIVRRLLDTTLVLIDGPIFRDADNDAGIYAAVSRPSLEGDWPGAALFRGVNESGWSEIVRYTDRTWIGVTTTDLPSWEGGWLSDESGTVTVSGIGELSSYTDDAIINGTAAAYVIGSEVLYARTATLVSPGVYTLSGLYRGRRGTEWAAALGTDTGADVVLIQTTGSGIRRVGFENGQLGAEFDFRAVTLGASIGSAETESITPMGVGLKPFAPVHVEADDNGDGTYEVTWQRRTRLSCRFTGSLGINTPLGESAESYAVDVWDGASVTSTQTVSDESATVTASPGDVVRVYQVSAIVGRGYVAELTL